MLFALGVLEIHGMLLCVCVFVFHGFYLFLFGLNDWRVLQALVSRTQDVRTLQCTGWLCLARRVLCEHDPHMSQQMLFFKQKQTCYQVFKLEPNIFPHMGTKHL